MKINNAYFGGFVVSNNICKGKKIKYSFREKSSIDVLNKEHGYENKENNAKRFKK